MSEPRAPDARERIAAIDVGSNSVRLLVAEYDPASGLSIIDELKDQPRLAAGLAATGCLNEAAIDRAIQSLGRMREVCQRRGVRRIAAVATAAVREAENGPWFVRRVRQELDIPLRIIDAETEAALSYRSVAHHFRLAGARTLVADIGGGSLELIGAVDGLVELTLSLPLGAVRLTELHVLGERADHKEIAALRAHIRRQLKRAISGREWAAATIIGSGGTFTSLGRMAQARRGLPTGETVHGVSVATAEVEQLIDWLMSRSPEQRRQVPGLNPERADIIVAGLAVTAELLDWVRARTLTVSAFGLREGLLLEMAGAEETVAPDPLRLFREFAERCQSDRRHVEQVRHLALLLFDQLGDELGCRLEERGLLEAAALLHDVGQLVSYRKHHKHSYQLIMHAERLGLPARDRALVALISRYHRRTGPRRKHPEFAALPPADQNVVRRVSALLRVADGLDRGHTATIETLSTELTPDALLIHIAPRLSGTDLGLESWGASRKADVLAKLIGRDVVIQTT
ncbi:MAG: Ppx/GppA family phosphatase [Gemmatimonadales bacterium]|nr:Ppx/GppA family phosphatase [Gemmatimonadales bacterium]MDQ3427281.1 Ppx/GppA family phosphatase [Gemmatimonadota bacterium]